MCASRAPPNTAHGEVLASFKVILLGAAGCGKSTLARRVQTGRFPRVMPATHALDIVHRTATLPSGAILALELWDTAGQERLRSLTYNYYRDAKAALLVYDSDSRLGLAEHVKDVAHNLGKDALLFLVAAKVDLGHFFVLDEQELKALCPPFGVQVAYHFRVSALSGEGVEDMVAAVALRLWERERGKTMASEAKRQTIRLKKEQEDEENKRKSKCKC